MVKKLFLKSSGEKPELSVTSLQVGYESIQFSTEARGVRGFFNLNRRFFPVLTSLSFKLSFDKQIIAVVGANGSGKTTLLRSLSGSIPSKGEISWDGYRIDGLSQNAIAKLGITFVPHENALFPDLSIKEHFDLLQRRGRREEVFDIIFKNLEAKESGLSKSVYFLKSTTKAGDLSGGEKKLLGLIRLLFHPWSLILIDEPTAALSPKWIKVYSVLVETLKPACIIQTEQYSRIKILKQLDSKIFELKEGSLLPFSGS